ncbi:MAG TPA: hypothetical protein VF169_23740 [Albitalea sp.]|uniref:hypothetical protein n=1 Tax=Piscinibacter sp. TaxID=1903157 RepID=UPI002ED5FFD0
MEVHQLFLPDVPETAIPSDMRDEGGSVLLTSATDGIVELRRNADGWWVSRRWTIGDPLPAGAFGMALYGEGDLVFVIVHSQGVFKLQGRSGTWVEWPHSGPMPLVVGMALQRGRGLWVGTGATIGAPNGGAAHFLPTQGEPFRIRIVDRQVQPGGSMLVKESESVWMATRSGVVQADTWGRLRLLSTLRVQTLFRNTKTGETAAVGASIQRWSESEGFVPVIFEVPFREPHEMGHPIDVVVDNQGRWTILYSGGKVVLLNAQRQFEALLDAEHGIEPTSRKLLHLPDTDEILIGTGNRGLSLLTRRAANLSGPLTQTGKPSASHPLPHHFR